MTNLHFDVIAVTACWLIVSKIWLVPIGLICFLPLASNINNRGIQLLRYHSTV